MNVKRRRLNALDPGSLLTVVLDLFNKLPKKGKPRDGEVTTLASVVVTQSQRPPTVISLATGTKCLPWSWACAQRVNDGHAEVLARRAAVDYLVREIAWLEDPEMNSERSEALVFKKGVKGVEVKNVQFHLVITELPCGDGAILESNSDPCHHADRTGAKRIKAVDPIASTLKAVFGLF